MAVSGIGTFIALLTPVPFSFATNLFFALQPAFSLCSETNTGAVSP